MKYYIEEYSTLLNLDDWQKIRKCLDHIDGAKVFCIEIFYNHIDNDLEIYYWSTEEKRDLIFDEINAIIS